jgi:hypothetical protein
MPATLAMAMEAMRNVFLNIPQGNTAAIVVREPWIDRDSRKTGSGRAAHIRSGPLKRVHNGACRKAIAICGEGLWD